ncbi:MATE efflux family protein [Musa troglodytarum]|uniref:MATE efflux family protein n=1 Tax=Musa troglodytarum TaxID=320322 RepID=A0A9E7FMR3_9LILI|nr:MATE efflux family protein [Musa troglodytarum]
MSLRLWQKPHSIWLQECFRLSSASAVMLCSETWCFRPLVLIAGLPENPELALDSLSVEEAKRRLSKWEKEKEPLLS